MSEQLASGGNIGRKPETDSYSGFQESVVSLALLVAPLFALMTLGLGAFLISSLHPELIAKITSSSTSFTGALKDINPARAYSSRLIASVISCIIAFMICAFTYFLLRFKRILWPIMETLLTTLLLLALMGGVMVIDLALEGNKDIQTVKSQGQLSDAANNWIVKNLGIPSDKDYTPTTTSSTREYLAYDIKKQAVYYSVHMDKNTVTIKKIDK